jgi:hypothetical protein
VTPSVCHSGYLFVLSSARCSYLLFTKLALSHPNYQNCTKLQIIAPKLQATH